MSSTIDRARTFAQLHVAGKPLILFNAWDPGSARTIAASGAPAIATGSWSVASAFGFGDGEKVPLALALDNLRRIVAAVDLPVSLDMESGYGIAPDAVGATFAQVLAAGAIGCNLEDGFVDGSGMHTVAAQAARIAAARAAAEKAGVPAFINARTDIFLIAPAATHDAAMVEDAVTRGLAYRDAGASGFFVPGLVDEKFIETICKRVDLPINIMASSKTPPVAKLAALGVARVSHGPGPYVIAMKALEAAAKAVYAASK
jgi:2-methylisocitrate lyase-like PEP mutase family enzyme